jgi:hypothetical protein
MAKADRARRRLTLADGLTTAVGQPGGSRLQGRADAAHDLLELIVLAERRGFSHRRAAVLSTRVSQSPSIPLPRVRKIELALRAWLRRRPM